MSWPWPPPKGWLATCCASYGRSYPPPAWPRRLRCVAAIPLTAVGKRDRAAILQYLAAQPAHEP